MKHYLKCPLLWKLLEELTGLTLPNYLSHMHCLTGQLRDTRVLALAHSVSHALKIGSYHTTGSVLSTQDVVRILKFAFDFGKPVASELM